MLHTQTVFIHIICMNSKLSSLEIKIFSLIVYTILFNTIETRVNIFIFNFKFKFNTLLL